MSTADDKECLPIKLNITKLKREKKNVYCTQNVWKIYNNGEKQNKNKKKIRKRNTHQQCQQQTNKMHDAMNFCFFLIIKSDEVIVYGQHVTHTHTQVYTII